MLNSMTGFAAGRGANAEFEWTWDIRSVNARGLDLRLRVPDWVPGLEQGLRKRLGETLHRGNITLNLRVSRAGGDAPVALDEDRVKTMLAALDRVEVLARGMGVDLAPSRAADILGLRGILDGPAEEADAAPLAKALLRDFETVLADFQSMRAKEGRALHDILAAQVGRTEELTETAAHVVEDRRDAVRRELNAALTRVVDANTGVEPERVAQELALIAVKSDVTEELDRLRAHVGAARKLLGQGGAVGRKLDFLMQEFNREANTLCSKSQNTAVTEVGLDLKAVIDQMREQVQNVE